MSSEGRGMSLLRRIAEAARSCVAIDCAAIVKKSTMMGAAAGILWASIERKTMSVRRVVGTPVINVFAVGAGVVHVVVVENTRAKARARARKSRTMFAVFNWLVAEAIGRLLAKVSRALQESLTGW